MCVTYVWDPATSSYATADGARPRCFFVIKGMLIVVHKVCNHCCAVRTAACTIMVIALEGEE